MFNQTEIQNVKNMPPLSLKASEILKNASDPTEPEQSSWTVVTITVNDKDDNAPEFNQTYYNATVLENSRNIPISFGDVFGIDVFDIDQVNHIILKKLVITVTLFKII